MPESAMRTLPLNSTPIEQVDWLELSAFLDRFRRARLDAIDGALEMQKQDQIEDIASADAEKDERRALIENEVDLRTKKLGSAYPFELSGDGEELMFRAVHHRAATSFYINCLVISHFTRSRVLGRAPKQETIDEVRRHQFQILSTLAVAGTAGGPAISIGWPRLSKETILTTIERCCALSGMGAARAEPGPEASPSAKDGGIDVIGWQPPPDGGPPQRSMWYAQAASGHGWAAKSSSAVLEKFFGGFWLDRPACNASTVTVIPHRISDDEHREHGRSHGHILDRVATPLAALSGLQLAKENGVLVEGFERVCDLTKWLVVYRQELQAA